MYLPDYMNDKGDNETALSHAGSFLLSGIKGPADLLKLDYPQLQQLADEIRATIIATVSKNGGHLASSLGAVEIILAMHRAFHSKDDNLLFDVGHQALAHKLLTGRFDQFCTLRQHDGISGFPRRSESPHDTYDTGHASDSLSIAAGLSLAKELNGSPGAVAVLIGDASISGGMAFEALNNIGQLKKSLTIILNDNEMSIAPNVGAMALYLGKIRLSDGYTQTRDRVESRVSALGGLGRSLMDLGDTAKNSVKKLLVKGSFFEDMGITYIGPIDGHNIEAMEQAMQAARHHRGPKIIHVVTKKGKGYAPAEKNPSIFHGVPSFDIDTGTVNHTHGASAFTYVLGQVLVNEGSTNHDLVAITAAMADGTGLTPFARKFPNRFFDVGISEEHAATSAAGLALGGKLPVLAVYSTFMQRAFDQIVTNIALQNLHVVMCLDRAGVVGADGSTHHGLFDIAYMRLIPNMTVLAPSTPQEMASAMKTALYEVQGPVAVRYPRKSEQEYVSTGDEQPWPHAKAVKLREGGDVAFLAVGRMVHTAMKAAEVLEQQGVASSVYDMRWIKPMDTQAVSEACACKLVVTIEDGTICGGFGDGVLEHLAQERADGRLEQVPQVLRMGFPDVFVQHGTDEQLFCDFGLSAQQVAQRVLDQMQD